LSGPTTINSTAAQLDTFLKGIDTVLQPVIQNILIGYLPALGLPVIKQITGDIEAAFENYITKIVETGATFAVIDLQTGSEDSKMDQASADLQTALASGNAQAIANAEDEFDAAQSAVANDDGSATPQ
jgi:hypothetical protein